MTKTDTPATLDVLDLGKLAFSNTAQMTVVHPKTGQPTTWVWDIAGPGHEKTVAQANRTSREATMEEARRQQAMVNGRKWKAEVKTPDQIRDENASHFAERVLGWSPVSINGKPLAYSPQAATDLLRDADYGWLFQQLITFLRDEDSFIGGSAPI